MGAAREFDIILWGATGFTGSLVAQHLTDTYGSELNWAMAGRNLEKLAALKARLGCEQIPLIQADSQDSTGMDALAARTRVVCTTVGPYALYGTPLLAACARTGTHYCDLTGEVQWSVGLVLLAVNGVGLWLSVRRLNQERANIPFLI